MSKFQFKHCTIISRSRFSGGLSLSIFQFKHCTIISRVCWRRCCTGYFISIQALYDYKIVEVPKKGYLFIFQFKHCTIIRKLSAYIEEATKLFQFKHCTIIRTQPTPHSRRQNAISIQALYDYKGNWGSQANKIFYFNSSIVRL